MKNRPIPLQTLHAFEAAARHLSFTRAADELNLSQSAISQQIQALEHALELKLFVRMTRKLVLTKQGDVFSQEVRNALKMLDDARNNLSSDKKHKRLSIVSTPSISSQWLIPNLQHFRLLYPDIEISIYQGEHPAAMEEYEADIGIFYGMGHWKNRQVTKIYQDCIFPVCHPDLLKNSEMKSINEIFNFTLLSDAEEKHDHWQEWFDVAGKHDQPIKTGINFDNMGSMISAALQEQGVALVRDLLVAEELENGSLIRLFDIEYAPPYATYFLRSSNSKNKVLVDIFYKWIKAMLEKHSGIKVSIPQNTPTNLVDSKSRYIHIH